MRRQLGPFNTYNIYDNCADHGGQLYDITANAAEQESRSVGVQDVAHEGNVELPLRMELPLRLPPPLQPQGGNAYPCGMMTATEYWMNLPAVL